VKLTATLNLKTRAVLATGGILLLAMLVNTLINAAIARTRYEEALIGRTNALAEQIHKDIRKAVGFGLSLNALEGMGDKLRGLLEEDRELSFAMLMDAEGKVLYASDRTVENTTQGDEASKKALAANEPLVQHFSDRKGGHYEQTIPLFGHDGKKIGVFRIALKEEAVNLRVRSLLLWSLLVGLVSFLIAIALVSLFMDRGITRPISELSQTAGVMAAGARRSRQRHQRHVGQSSGNAPQYPGHGVGAVGDDVAHERRRAEDEPGGEGAAGIDGANGDGRG
jgi:sensor histidine kinase regulating citrate/malate metabolism